MIRQARRLDFRSCKVGDSASMVLQLTPKLVADFASYTGDYNPLHMDQSYASQTQFKRRVVHGMAYGSFISRLIGMDLPGEGALWTSQSYNFAKPVFLGDTLTLTVEVVQVTESTRTLKLNALAVNQDSEQVMSGTGEVMALERQVVHSLPAKSSTTLALVTGGSRGIGAAVVQEFALRKIPVVFTFRQRSEEALALRDRLRSEGAKIWTFPYNAEDGTRGATDLLREIASEAGDPTALVACAASTDFYGGTAETEWDKIERQIQIHVGSVYSLTKSMIPAMEQNGSGSVVLLGTSYLGGTPPLNLIPYLTAKHALQGLMKSMAVELGPKNIRVNMVSPSMTETELLSRVPQRQVKVAAQQNPMRRLGLPDDIAKAITFLCSSDASYVNGHNLIVSGGSAML